MFSSAKKSVRAGVRLSRAAARTVRPLVEALEDRRLLAASPYGGTAWTVPGRIEAENFDLGGQGVSYNDTTTANEGGKYRTSEGVDVEATTDAGGGYDVGWAHTGEWMKYTVNVASSGTYDFDARVANYGTGGAFHVEVDGVNVTGTLGVPNTNNFQAFTDVVKTGINLTAGQHVVTLVIDGQSQYGFAGNFNWFQFTQQTPSVTIAATTPNASESGPTNGLFTVTRTGSTASALTVNYTVGGTATNGTDYASLPGTVTIAAGQSSATIAVAPVDDTLVEGNETVILTLASGTGYSVGGASAATVTIADNDSPPPGTSTPYGGTAWAVPGVIETENYDVGGEGVAYHDTTANNEGGAYRTTEGVDVEPTTDAGGGYDVGWAHTGEWLQYTVNVASAGTYNVVTRAANYGTGGTFHIEVDGVNVTGALAVPNTGGFQTYTDITKTGVSLTAGQHVVRLVMDGMSQYGFSGNFNRITFAAVGQTPPAVTVAATTPNASETGPTNGVFTLTRTGSTTSALTVNYAITGTATNGTDYATLPGTVTFAAGQSTATVIVAPVDDSLVEGAETVILTLQSGSGYTIGSSASGTVTIADNDVAAPPPSGSTPFSGTPIALPGVIEAENYDKGGEGVAYHDTTANNEAGAYRTAEGVDIEALSGGGYAVDYTHAGEWLQYTVNLASGGTYNFAARAANYGTGGAFHVEVDGVNITGTLGVPNTNSFTAFTDVTKAGINLTAGQHVVRLVMDGNSQYGFSGNFDSLKFTQVVPPAGGGWVPYAQLTAEDKAVNTYPSVTGAGIGVAVIDRGINTSAPGLSPGKVVYSYNFRDGNTNGADDYGHGTGVAGIIAAGGYSYGSQYNQGVAPGVNLIDLKQESSAGVKAALDWVLANYKQYNIQVVNLTDFVTDVQSGAFNPSIYQSELQQIHDLGIVITTPAGNGEAQYGPNAPMTYPALSPYVIAVSGFDQNNNYYADALRGPAVDVLGPASNVTMPYYIKNPNSVGYDQFDDNYDGTTAVVNYALGTSWASAYTAGLAALIKQINPAFTADQVAQIIKDSGTPTLDPTNNVYVPRININNAIALAYQRLQQPTGTMTVGANVNVTKMTGSESGGQVAVNPANPNQMVIVSESGDNSGDYLPFSRSSDGGKTWTTSLIGPNIDGFGNTPRPDPRVIFDSFGNLYLTYLVAAGQNDIRLVAFRSSDGGASFQSLGSIVSGSGYDPDSPWIAVGRDAKNASLQHVWISFTDYKSNRILISGGTSSGLGQFGGWSAPATVNHSFGTYSSVAVGANGEVAVAWQTDDSGQGPNNLMLTTDSTGTGTSWSADKFLSSTNVGGYDFIPAQPERSIDAEVHLAFDRSGGSTNGRLYAVYTDESPDESNNTDIYLKYSDNLGQTWSTPVKVNDDGGTTSQFLPAIAVDPTTGYVGITWLDSRNSVNNTGAQLYATVSVDHGASVKPNVKVSAGVSYQAGGDPNTNDMDFGDNNSLSFLGGKLVGVWSDNANTTGDNPGGTGKSLDVYTDTITVA